jgi:hypothetical protein
VWTSKPVEPDGLSSGVAAPAAPPVAHRDRSSLVLTLAVIAVLVSIVATIVSYTSVREARRSSELARLQLEELRKASASEALAARASSQTAADITSPQVTVRFAPSGHPTRRYRFGDFLKTWRDDDIERWITLPSLQRTATERLFEANTHWDITLSNFGAPATIAGVVLSTRPLTPAAEQWLGQWRCGDGGRLPGDDGPPATILWHSADCGAIKLEAGTPLTFDVRSCDLSDVGKALGTPAPGVTTPTYITVYESFSPPRPLAFVEAPPDLTAHVWSMAAWWHDAAPEKGSAWFVEDLRKALRARALAR